MLPPPRNIARYTTTRGPNVYLGIVPLIPRYLDYQQTHVYAAIFKQYRVLPSVRPDAVRCVEIRRRRTRHILTLSQAEKLPFAVNILHRRDSQI